jgi:wyosine [tRNA(Phe)-imidazoG37] synthetase (radical SAM superfamily)
MILDIENFIVTRGSPDYEDSACIYNTLKRATMMYVSEDSITRYIYKRVAVVESKVPEPKPEIVVTELED